MSFANFTWFILEYFVPYLVHYDTLLKNVTGTITKGGKFFLENATKVYYKMRHVFYYKMGWFYNRMGQLLQNATFVTKCVDTCWIKNSVKRFYLPRF